MKKPKDVILASTPIPTPPLAYCTVDAIGIWHVFHFVIAATVFD